MSRLARWLPNCQETARLLSDSLDRTLPFHKRVQIHLHLRMCVICTAYSRHLQLIHELFKRAPVDLIEPGPAPEPGLSAEAKARFQRALESSRQHPH